MDRIVAAFRRFQQVILVDATYCTNINQYPLLNIVAVDNHQGYPLLSFPQFCMKKQTPICVDWVLNAFVTKIYVFSSQSSCYTWEVKS